MRSMLEKDSQRACRPMQDNKFGESAANDGFSLAQKTRRGTHESLENVAGGGETKRMIQVISECRRM